MLGLWFAAIVCVVLAVYFSADGYPLLSALALAAGFAFVYWVCVPSSLPAIECDCTYAPPKTSAERADDDAVD